MGIRPAFQAQIEGLRVVPCELVGPTIHKDYTANTQLCAIYTMPLLCSVYCRPVSAPHSWLPPIPTFLLPQITQNFVIDGRGPGLPRPRPRTALLPGPHIPAAPHSPGTPQQRSAPSRQTLTLQTSRPVQRPQWEVDQGRRHSIEVSNRRSGA